MVQLADLPVGEGHPVALEIASLKSAVARFQAGADEAHASSTKLQRHSLNATRVHERLAPLERENNLLKAELAVLRANPHPDTSPQSHPAALQVQQLSLSLRHLSDKLSLTEHSLLERTTELAHAKSETARAKLTAEGAYELAARVRGREESGKVRERELEWKIKTMEEELKMSDTVLKEYADLVRSLEGRPSLRMPAQPSHSSSGDVDSGIAATAADASLSTSSASFPSFLEDRKLELRKLVAEFQGETEKLQAELDRMYDKLVTSEARCESDRKSAELDRSELTKAQFELQKLKLDDNAAAKMVSRYMKFSQKSTDTLQQAMQTLKTRHAATVDTLSSQLYATSSQLQFAEAAAGRIRDALDELGGEIMKETYGRRREVALRIRLVNREEKTHEALRRWIRRAEEAVGRAHAGSAVGGEVKNLEGMVQDAKMMLESLDGPVTETMSLSGSLGRLIVAQNTVDGLVDELRSETARRLELERMVATMQRPLEEDEEELEEEHPEQLNVVEDEHIGNGNASIPDGPSQDTLPDQTDVSLSSTAPSTPITKDVRSSPKPSPPISVSTDCLVPSTTAVEDGPSPPTSSEEIPTSNYISNGTAYHLKTSSQADVANAYGKPFPPLPLDDVVLVAAELPSKENVEKLSEASSSNSPPGNIQVEEPTCPSTGLNSQSSLLNEGVTAAVLVTGEGPRNTFEGTLEMPSIEGLSSKAASENPSTDPCIVKPSSTVVALDNSRSLHPTNGLAAPNIDLAITDKLVSETSEEQQPQVVIVTANVDFVHQPAPQSPQEVGAVVQALELLLSPNIEPPAPPEAPSPSPLGETVQPLPTPISSPPTPIPSAPTVVTEALPEAPQPTPHPLLKELAQISKRYDNLQRAFRDCHMALESLKRSISPPASTPAPPSLGSAILPSSSTAASKTFGSIPSEIIHAALDRLNDYNEDARVELEIRTSDEALLAKGYETLLSVPGALGSSSKGAFSHHRQDSDDMHDAALSQPEAELQIETFIAGTDPSIQRAREGFSKKLEDIQHDIAAMKQAIFNPEISPLSATLSPAKAEGNGGWTSWIRGSPSRPSSPALLPAASATFGNIMTSPRLRHAPSLNFQRKGSFLGGGGGATDPLASLGLRVPMPSFAIQQSVVSPTTPQRSRTVSTMYMLGLGSIRSPSGSFSSSLGSPQKKVVPKMEAGETEDETEDEEDGDVE